ncbi:MAG: hypothetical protein H6734_20230 [Alphaproteobacteria bacterium]|nr:hypothetical protein [Alphaproteobacteria bacterium]
MNLNVDWVVDALLRQVRQVAEREGSPPVAVRLRVAPPDGPRVAKKLKEHLPGVELEVVEREGHPRVLMVSFALER